MNTFPIPGRASDGDYDTIDFSAPDLRAAHARACDDLAGTRWTPEPLPTECPVRLALRKVRLASNGVLGASALWQASDELCADPDPAAMWLQQRERHLRALAEHAGTLAKAAMVLATEAAAGLPLREQLAASVKVEAVAAE